METINWLEEYFRECCNGDWEHTYQIRIETLDNPGWLVDIDLEDTTLEDVNFEEVKINRDEGDWLICRIEGNIFKGRGGTKNLKEILSVFREWVLQKDNITNENDQE
jgi:hypothetical protein